MELKEKIKKIRQRLHLTQEKFADGLGIETSYIGRIETGIRRPGRKTIEKICSTYNIDPREFFETRKKAIMRKKDPLTAELEKLPADKKDLILKCVNAVKDMDTEGIREIIKHTEKEKLWEKVRKKERRGY
jgi:transcriptional regulator with XRE-family HTH domain